MSRQDKLQALAELLMKASREALRSGDSPDCEARADKLTELELDLSRMRIIFEMPLNAAVQRRSRCHKALLPQDASRSTEKPLAKSEEK